MEMFKFAIMRVLLFALMPFFAFAQSHSEAKALLNKVYETTVNLKTQHITFDQVTEAPSNGGMKPLSMSGELFAKGEMVRVNTGAFQFLSDGTNAYLIYPDDEEIEKVANAEENDLSPGTILEEYQSGYSYKMAGKSTEGGKNIQYIVLKPNASEEIKEILVGIDTKTNLLHSYKQFMTNNTINTFTVTSYEVNSTFSKDYFNIKSDELKGYFMN
jgi:outer membrane lipoprotein-sorting protein